MMPKGSSSQQPKKDEVIDGLRAIIQSKTTAEQIAVTLPDELSVAVEKACRLMA